MSDHALTMRDVPVIELDGRRFPVFFPVRRQEAWAERLGQTLDELLVGGLPFARLAGADLRDFLHSGLEGGEARRHALEGGQALSVSDTELDRILDLFAWSEVATLLMSAWNWPPAEPDPPTSTAPTEAPSRSSSPRDSSTD